MKDVSFMQASRLNWPRANLPAAMLYACLLLCHQCQLFPFILGEWICGITILKTTQFRPIHIFTLGNCRLFRCLQTPTSYSSLSASPKTSHRVSSFCYSPHLARQQTTSFPHWLVRTMVVFHVDATPRVVLCEGAASNRRILLEQRRWSMRLGSNPRQVAG